MFGLNEFFKMWLSRFRGSIFQSSAHQPPLVAERFIQLFNDHGVEVNQIPRFVPDITLNDLASTESLLKKLTPDCLDSVAHLFGIEVAWLEGGSEQIYPPWSCYKDPQKFLDLLENIRPRSSDYALRIFTTASELNYESAESQPFIMVVCERINIDFQKPVYKYYVDTEWQWTEDICRLQLKSHALLYYQKLHCPIPIYKITQSDFDALSEWRCVPNTLINSGLLTTPSFEDYILDNNQSVVAKEVQELPQVRAYVSEHQLALNLAVEPETFVTEIKAGNAISVMTSKNAKARYVELDAIKANFIQFHNETKSQNRTASAKTFFNKLDQRSKLTLVPTYDERDLEATISKAVRTLTKALRDSEK